MHCPKCKTNKLKQGKVMDKDILIDYCTKCKGIWFDHREVEEMIANSVRDLKVSSKAQSPSAVCPRCQQLLYEFYYPQTFVNIDMCDSCKGIWVDAGELKEIQAVRNQLAKAGKANEYPEPTGIKGALLRFIEVALQNANNF